MKRTILVTGGARSGKSSYALERCETRGKRRCFVATCPVIDPEMDDRIRRHRQEREGRGWDCREEERDLAGLLPLLAEYDVVLIDCLTLWINNLMYRGEQEGYGFGEDEMRRETGRLASAIDEFPNTVCLVTNEVGLGVVPENSLARRYRDLVGSCNRLLAKQADEVILVTCGIPLSLKELSVNRHAGPA